MVIVEGGSQKEGGGREREKGRKKEREREREGEKERERVRESLVVEDVARTNLFFVLTSSVWEP